MTAGSVVVPFIIPIRVPSSGKAKHEIDTNTPIEIKSDTPDASVFFTLDGTKPEVQRKLGPGDGITLRYTEPIRLPSGKIHIRALAVTSDGRQSAVVTKVFTVEKVISEDLEQNQDASLKSLEQSTKQQKHKNDAAETLTQCLGNLSITRTQRIQKGPRFQSKHLNTSLESPTLKHTQSTPETDSQRKEMRTSLSRILKETDFLRCLKCLSHRPSDPFARFCLHCGSPVPPIPGQRLNLTGEGQMILCAQCKSVVPDNAVTCVVCETPVTPQLESRVSCEYCGTENPANITCCVLCESRLPQKDTPVFSGQRAPPLPCSEKEKVSCSKCNRENHSDARFCDWCGAKPGPPAKDLTCSQCGASGHPYSNFCGHCGVFLEGPPREPLSPTKEAAEIPDQRIAVPTVTLVDAQTQTTGLFYPSSAELQKREQLREAGLSRHGQMSDKKPLLTAISPGRGFWRKQLDHICTHLRCYTQNNIEFRALVGEPKMGRLVSAFIEEDSCQVSLRVNFILATPNKSMALGGKLNESTHEESNHSAASEVNGIIESEMGTAHQRKTCTLAEQSESKESLLIKEVGPAGKGRITVVQELLNEGASPSCLSNDGRPVLVATVLNGHHDIIPVLVQKDADVDQQSGPLNNTALHEAAALGTSGLRCVEVLLRCNANTRKLNDHGQTAYNVAEITGCSAMLSLFASHIDSTQTSMS